MSESMSSESNNNYDLIIAGGGLGGLLSAALATKIAGLRVLVLEQLSFIGGRFTSFDIDGFSVPSGAVHMIPFGKKGPMGEILIKKLSLDEFYDFDIYPTQHFTGWRWPDRKKEIRHKYFMGSLKGLPGLRRKYLLLKFLLNSRKVEKLPKNFSDYLNSLTDDKYLKQFFLSIIGFSMSLNLEEISTKEAIGFLKAQYKLGKPGVPKGGCKNVITLLEKTIIKYGGKILKNQHIIEIRKEKNYFIAITKQKDKKEMFTSPYLISNMGPKQTAKVAEKLIDKDILKNIEESNAPRGFGFSYALDKSINGHSGITLTPGKTTFCGLVEPSHICKELAPSGKHLLLTHHIIPEGMSHEDALKLGRKEISEVFPEIKEFGKEICVHSFSGLWGTNKTIQGNEFRDIGIENMWLVGDGSKSTGMLMTEGVADSVLNAISELKFKVENKNFS